MDEKMKELSQVLPSEIEARSFEIITEELGERTFPEKEAPIVKRVGGSEGVTVNRDAARVGRLDC